MINQIDPQQLLTHMRAAQSQATQQPVNNTPAQQPADFAKLMKGAVDKVNAIQMHSSELKTAFEMGEPNVTLADTMIASQKASVAFEATLQVRNRLVKAYEEVMRMSV